MGLKDEIKAEVVYIPENNGKNNQKLQPEKVEERSDTLFLYFSVLTATLIYLSGAMEMVWTSPVIPKLQSNDTNINPLGRPITPYEISLLAGVPRIAGILGMIFFAKIGDILGRKRGLICLGLGMLVSNVLVAFGSHIYVYIVGRTLFSIFFGGVLSNLPVYLLEIAEKHNRAKFVVFMSVSIPTGTLLSFIFGPLLSVRMFTLLTVSPILPFLLFFTICVPESPVILAVRGKRDESLNVLKKLRSNKTEEEIKEDFREIEKELESRKDESSGNVLWPFNTKALRKAFLISTVINLTHHCSGSSVIMSFMGPMFDEAQTSLSGDKVAILVGILKMISYCTTGAIVERSGRRILILLSSITSGVALFFLGFYFYWKNTNAAFLDSIRWLPIALIFLFIISYAMGLGPLTTVVIGELFPNDLKSLAFSYQGVFTSTVTSVWIILYPLVAYYLGIQYCLWMFSINLGIGFVAIYFILPETKGKNYLEMHEMLNK